MFDCFSIDTKNQVFSTDTKNNPKLVDFVYNGDSTVKEIVKISWKEVQDFKSEINS